MSTKKRNKGIAKAYNKMLSGGTTSEDAVEKLADEHKVNKFYIRSILRAEGIVILRKNAVTVDSLSPRDRKIMALAEQNITPDAIASEVGLTSTRVRQIIRENVDNIKNIKMERLLSDIKNDVQKYMPYKEIIEKYGVKTLKDLKAITGYSLSKAWRARRDEFIVLDGKAGKTAKQTGVDHNKCKDYVLAIWHANGLYKSTIPDLTPNERAARNKRIYEECLVGKMIDIKEKYELSYTMIKIIFKQQRDNLLYKDCTSGMSVSQAAKKYKITESTVTQIFNQQKKKREKKKS